MPKFNTPEWDKKFRSIFADIRQNKCVVLVGPEIVKIGKYPLRDILRDQLNKSNDADIAHYYKRDGFFLFRDKIAKEDVQREVILFYQDHQTETDVEENIFKQLVQLKTHLILSINPDNFLSDVAYKYGIKHRFAFFQHGGEAVSEVEEPTTEMPLFYNLCGAICRDDSLVLDYDDLFSLLSSLLNGSPERGLPKKVRTTLQTTKHFLFIGFDFDKWYSQLLLRLLSGEKAIRKFAIDHSEKEENTTTFLVKQFGIEFIDDEAAFLMELFRQCKVQGLMRDIIEAQTPDAVRVIRHIQNGEMLKALTYSYEQTKNKEIKNTLTILLNQFNNLQEQQRKGTIDSRDAIVQWNKITDALLESLKMI